MGGVIFELIVHSLLAVVYLTAMIMGYRLIKRLYGGKFTSALPYFLIGISLIFGLIVLDVLDIIFYVLESSELYAHSILVIQVLAGFFFILALYQIYQARFATEGFIGFDADKGGKRK